MGGLSVAFALGTGTGKGFFGSVNDNHNGKYTALFTATTSGSNTINATVKINGQTVNFTPCPCRKYSTGGQLWGQWLAVLEGQWGLAGAYCPGMPTTWLILPDASIVAGFGSNGLWRWTATGWQKLSGLNCQTLVACPDGSIGASFGTQGLWRGTSSNGWQKLSNYNAQTMVASPGRIPCGRFWHAGFGRWTTTIGWQLLSSLNDQTLKAAPDGSIAAGFGTSGLCAGRPPRRLEPTQAVSTIKPWQSARTGPLWPVLGPGIVALDHEQRLANAEWPQQ